MRLQEILEAAQQLTESMDPIEVELTKEQLSGAIPVLLQDVAEVFQDKVAGDSESPSAPNTSSFMAQHKGMIQYCRGVSTGGSYYSPSRSYDYFLKVGSNVELSVRKEMRVWFAKNWARSMGFEIPAEGSFRLQTIDGATFTFGSMDGSAWGGFGFSVS